MIRAECHSDDQRYSAEFDASAWFAEASDEELIALSELSGPGPSVPGGRRGMWGGDYESDAIARFFENALPAVGKVLDHTHGPRHGRSPLGFECYVNATDAREWIAQERPHLVARIVGGA